MGNLKQGRWKAPKLNSIRTRILIKVFFESNSSKEKNKSIKYRSTKIDLIKKNCSLSFTLFGSHYRNNIKKIFNYYRKNLLINYYLLRDFIDLIGLFFHKCCPNAAFVANNNKKHLFEKFFQFSALSYPSYFEKYI